MEQLRIIPAKYLTKFKHKVGFDLKQSFEKIAYKNFEEEIFYYNTNSVASSAKIEGEIASSQDLIQYLQHKKRFNPNYINATNDLFNAYVFTQKHTLNKLNILKVHKLLSKNLLVSYARGKIRNHDEFIYNQEGRIIYTATSKEILSDEFEKLISDIDNLLKQELSVKEVFYYAFMLSLVFVKIHPSEDGNGRTSRLLEKWFIAEKLGKKAWFIKSELSYFNKRKSYFLALNRMGLFYEDTDYSKAISISVYTANTLREH